MTDLVFINGNKVITDSLVVAQMFGKEHKNVLRDINIQFEYAGEEFGRLNFELISYTDSMNRSKPKYNLTEEAFALVVFSYNTKEAVQTKIKFIQEFKRMREYIQKQQNSPKPLSEIEQLKASMRLSLETSEEVEVLKVEVSEVKQEVEQLKDSIHISSSQAKALRKKVGERVYDALGGKESNAFDRMKSKMFAACWSEFKNYFDINEYRELPRVSFEDGMKFLLMWQPSTELRLEVEHYNTQMKLHLVK